jgi:hypothetical protein
MIFSIKLFTRVTSRGVGGIKVTIIIFVSYLKMKTFFVTYSGFMTEPEKVLFSAIPANEFNTYWVPCTWFIYRL